MNASLDIINEWKKNIFIQIANAKVKMSST